MRVIEQLVSSELADKGGNGGLEIGHEIPHDVYTQCLVAIIRNTHI